MANPPRTMEDQLKVQAVEELITALALKLDRQTKAVDATKVHIDLLRETLVS